MFLFKSTHTGLLFALISFALISPTFADNLDYPKGYELPSLEDPDCDAPEEEVIYGDEEEDTALADYEFYREKRAAYLQRIGRHLRGEALCDDCFTPAEIFPRYIRLYNTQGKGIGYRRPYTSIEAFVVPRASKYLDLQLFTDARVHFFNNGNAAGNFGAGVRFLNADLPAVMGFNFYFDFRQEHREFFKQVGIGYELLGLHTQFRINGYLPIGDKKQRGPTHFYKYPGGFFATCHERRMTIAGVDAEVSANLRQFGHCCFWGCEGGVGLYAYKTKCGRKVFGGKARLTIPFYKYFGLEVRATYDSLYRGGIQGVLSLNFPFGVPYKTQPACILDPCDRLRQNLQSLYVQRVQRAEIIVVDKKQCIWRSNFGGRESRSLGIDVGRIPRRRIRERI